MPQGHSKIRDTFLALKKSITFYLNGPLAHSHQLINYLVLSIQGRADDSRGTRGGEHERFWSRRGPTSTNHVWGRRRPDARTRAWCQLRDAIISVTLSCNLVVNRRVFYQYSEKCWFIREKDKNFLCRFRLWLPCFYNAANLFWIIFDFGDCFYLV